MTRVTHLLSWSPLLFAAFFLIYWWRIMQNEFVSFDEFVLEKQANYAADAAVEELMFSGHLEMDYGSQFTQVDPDLAVTEFSSILADCFGYSQSSVSNATVQLSNIKALLVCAWDGVYAYTPRYVDTEGRVMFSGTPKIPYFYTANKGGSGESYESSFDDGQGQVQYALNLGFKQCYRDMIQDGKYKITKTDCPVAKEVQLTAINNQVADLLNYTLQESYNQSGQPKNVDLPDTSSTIKGKQPVDTITVIGVVTTKASSLTTFISADCIGGAQVIVNDPIIGYEIVGNAAGLLQGQWSFGKGKGTKVYERSSFWKKFIAEYDKNSNLLPNSTFTKPQYFESEFDAAKNGYSRFMYKWED